MPAQFGDQRRCDPGDRPQVHAARPSRWDRLGTSDLAIDAPSLWPVIGPITSSFGEREDPVMGNGEGEFHTGVDISAPAGTPVRATADGVVKSADIENGYGREVIIDNGHGTGNLLRPHVRIRRDGWPNRGARPGDRIRRARPDAPPGANLHYEVRIHNTPVNPHKYMRETHFPGWTAVAAGS